MVVVKKMTQHQSKEIRRDDKEDSRSEGEREGDGYIFSSLLLQSFCWDRTLSCGPPVESILILKLEHRRCCAERVGVVGFSSSHILMVVEAKAAGHHRLQK